MAALERLIDMLIIDPHVHLRDWNEAHKETMAHGFSVAWAAGISALFEMPNTSPPLTKRSSIERRIAEADEILRRLDIPLFHGLHAGITANPDQIRQIVSIHDELFPRVVGFKLYVGHSTGDMGITEISDQLKVWKTLAGLGYRGVVAIHAENQKFLRPELQDSKRPETHGMSRPPLSEVAAIQTQLVLAETVSFRGHLHFCHVSLSDSLSLIRSQQRGLPFGVTIGVTPHHLMLNDSQAARSALLSVNPPIRNEKNRNLMFQHVLRGDVDWIETDHAPHTLADKRRGASGLPGFAGLRLLFDRFEKLGVSALDFAKASGDVICDTYGIDGSAFVMNEKLSDYYELAGEYPWNPYEGMDS